jgi:hypothetical protein
MTAPSCEHKDVKWVGTQRGSPGSRGKDTFWCRKCGALGSSGRIGLRPGFKTAKWTLPERLQEKKERG